MACRRCRTSLNNAIGINEAPAEMYGKLMSDFRRAMWKYFLLLTDLRGSQVEAFKEDVSAGRAHPMVDEEAPCPDDYRPLPRSQPAALES